MYGDKQFPDKQGSQTQEQMAPATDKSTKISGPLGQSITQEKEMYMKGASILKRDMMNRIFTRRGFIWNKIFWNTINDSL